MSNTETKPSRPLNLTELVAEIEGLFTECDAWFHRETGEVYTVMHDMDAIVGEDEDEQRAEIDKLDEAGLLVFIDRPSWEDWDRAERFVGGLPEGAAAFRIADVMSGRRRGKWGRFKDALAAAGLLQDWYDYRLAAVRRDVIGLLDGEGISYREDAAG